MVMLSHQLHLRFLHFIKSHLELRQAGIPVPDACFSLHQKPQLTLLLDRSGPARVLLFHVVEAESAGLIKTRTEAKDMICI